MVGGVDPSRPPLLGEYGRAPLTLGQGRLQPLGTLTGHPAVPQNRCEKKFDYPEIAPHCRADSRRGTVSSDDATLAVARQAELRLHLALPGPPMRRDPF
jgi:hypothetical protein